jgi:hypothetical protein
VIPLEIARLNLIFDNLPRDTKTLNEGLISRAAYMLATLQDYEKDLDENGYVEMFSQSDKVASYERERPVARLYNSMNKNYQSIMKQLSDLLPKPEARVKGDGLDDFINDRDD